MRDRIYRALVSRIPGIRSRYLRLRERGAGRPAALFYLFWLHIRYYLLFDRSLREPGSGSPYEYRRLEYKESESSRSGRQSPREYARDLMGYDLISFDIFDTLILRPFSDPTDLFFLVGRELHYPDFRRLRILAEQKARKRLVQEGKSPEASLEDIWREMETVTGIPARDGMLAEKKWEEACCEANPFFQQVFRLLKRQGKRVIAVSDMYLPESFLRRLLSRCGYEGFEQIYVSCETGKSKHDGSLYRAIREAYGAGCSILHIGDNPYSDQKQALANGFSTQLYQNCQTAGNPYRAQDLSSIAGSLYRGIVNTHLHCGISRFSREYEYGFVYGGLFVTGFCQFLHDYVQHARIDKLLFLSRDGDVLLKAYRKRYPDASEQAVYAHWSRLAAVKLTAGFYKSEYFTRFLTHKENQGYSIRQILRSMELKGMEDRLCRTVGLNPGDLLTHKNAGSIQDYLEKHWSQVLAQYEPQRNASGQYYRALLKGCRRAAAVDIGWAGSGAMMLSLAAKRLWDIPCKITGVLAGTNSAFSPHPDVPEPFFISGEMVSYLFSAGENRDLWKFHDPGKGHNLLWELLLGSPQGGLKGFSTAADGSCVLQFQRAPENGDKIREIHRGILDFAEKWNDLEQRFGMEIPISGRDAYAPMLLALSRKNKKFLHGLEGLMDEAVIG